MAYHRAGSEFMYENQPWLHMPTYDAQQARYANARSASPDEILKKEYPEVTTTEYVSRHPHSDRLSKSFTSRLQLRKILFENFLRWILNVVLLIFVFAALLYWERRGNITNRQKHIFNAIITGLNLLLALAFFSALKEYAKILRWRVLARKGHTMREVDTILAGESVSKLLGLWLHHVKAICGQIFRNIGLARLFKGSSHRYASPPIKYLSPTAHSHGAFSRVNEEPSKKIAIFPTLWSLTKINAWLALNIMAQVAVACIGLTYGVQSGTPIMPAPVAASGAFGPDLSHFYPLGFTNTPPSSGSSEEAAAHTMGDLGTTYYDTNITGPNDPQTMTIWGSTYYYWIEDQTSGEFTWFYRYFNYDTDSFFSTVWAVPTNRTIKTSYANCQADEVLQGGNGSSYNVQYQLPDGTKMWMGVDLIGEGTTTYLYPNDEYSICANKDPRCAHIGAFQEPTANDPAMVFWCDITTHEVVNADPNIPGQVLQDAQARNASASASLNGYGTQFDHFTSSDQPTYWQYTRYTEDSYWSLKGRSADGAGVKMAEFAIASLAAMANINPRLSMPGPIPVQGVEVQVEWKWVRLLFPLIAASHFLLFVIVVFITSPYIVRDDSALANALLLRPMVEKIGPAGTGGCLDGREIAEIIDRDHLKGKRVAYSAVKTRDSMSSGPGGGPAVGGDVYRLTIVPIEPGAAGYLPEGRASSLSMRKSFHRDGTYE